jgi:hypothetical protein
MEIRFIIDAQFPHVDHSGWRLFQRIWYTCYEVDVQVADEWPTVILGVEIALTAGDSLEWQSKLSREAFCGQETNMFKAAVYEGVDFICYADLILVSYALAPEESPGYDILHFMTAAPEVHRHFLDLLKEQENKPTWNWKRDGF